ncbi:MAG: MarR family winged helix-turn-helix transcriptional regulator [Burkholderiales bacterium]
MPQDAKAHAWAVLLTAHATLLERIEAALAAAELPPLGWYDALWELEKAGGRLRMRDLARRVVLSKSNLSRLADRLEAAGLVGRADASDDGRGYDLVLTRAGRAMRKRMWPVYEARIEALFARHVSTEEARAIGEALGRAVKAARGT